MKGKGAKKPKKVVAVQVKVGMGKPSMDKMMDKMLSNSMGKNAGPSRKK